MVTVPQSSIVSDIICVCIQHALHSLNCSKLHKLQFNDETLEHIYTTTNYGLYSLEIKLSVYLKHIHDTFIRLKCGGDKFSIFISFRKKKEMWE